MYERILRIQPLEFKGERLDEVGKRIVAIFHPLFTGYSINDKLQLSDTEAGLITERNSAHETIVYSPSLPKLFLDYIKPLLVITSLGVINNNRTSVYGGSDKFYEVDFISAYKSYGVLNSDHSIDAIVSVAIHELGHRFGLEHHKWIGRYTSKQKYCPMTTEHIWDKAEGRITSSEYLSLQDSASFCRGCTKKVERLKKEIRRHNVLV
ncbi:MAG TPA: hypothetical protein VI564_00265 [Candidatus Nanoarchaeia archaeon]|nr:hypothetical protein [Candidatus Nanoarchaeia archaeon]